MFPQVSSKTLVLFLKSKHPLKHNQSFVRNEGWETMPKGVGGRWGVGCAFFGNDCKFK